MDNAEYVWLVLDSLREKGIPVDVDDVETAYLSLSNLQKPPVNYIKLYQSLDHQFCARSWLHDCG